jgi:hypothetical protein
MNFKIYDPISDLIDGGSNLYLSTSGGFMKGAIVQQLAPVNPFDVVNKTYVDNTLLNGIPDATTTVKGKVKLSGDLSGTADLPVIAPLAVTNAKLNPGPNSTLKGTVSGSVDDIVLGSGLVMAGSTLNVDTAIIPKADNAQFGLVQFDPIGDLTETALLSGIAVIGVNKVTNAKLADMTGVSQLKGSNNASPSAFDITLGSGLFMNGSVLTVDSATLPTVPVANGGTGATSLTGYLKGNGTSPVTGVNPIPVADVQGAVVSVNGVSPVGGNVTVAVGTVTTGVLSDRPSQPISNGDMYVVSGDPTTANNGRTFVSTGSSWEEITSNLASTDTRYVKKAGDTMTGVLNMPTGTKVTLVDAPIVATDAANKQYVDDQIAGATPDATTAIKGKIQLAGDFDSSSTADIPIIKSATPTLQGKIQLAGDFDSSSTANVPIIGANKITYPKIQQVSAVSLLGNPTSAPTNVQEIGLGTSLLFDSGTLKSPFSFYGGTDPNMTSPVDRPASSNTLYMGTDGQLWIWTSPIYRALTPIKLLVRAKDVSLITLNLNDYVNFGTIYIFRSSNNGLTITQPSNTIFEMTLGSNREPVFIKLTVSIGGFYSNNWGHFFTWNVTTSSYNLDCPGLFITPNNSLGTTNRTHVYTEILKINPGTVQFAVKLREIYGGVGPVNIGLSSVPLVPNPYRYIMFEET